MGHIKSFLMQQSMIIWGLMKRRRSHFGASSKVAEILLRKTRGLIIIFKNSSASLQRKLGHFWQSQKCNAIWRKQYMTWEQEMKHQRHVAFDEGARQNAIENAKVLLADGRYTLEEIVKLLGIPEEELRTEISMETSSV